jgi:hypothetical protein
MACIVENQDHSLLDTVNDVNDLQTLSNRLERQFSYLVSF